ncbi:hypothetical protein BAU15_06790 [Enterococcus sp. JM4C]|uniref:glycosyltransferase family 39 protein n=1 Tax=Candidatus Enterococcus huntleyi TaxID=1857217 RepID=UPI0013798B1D|nr:glycosyltransferase family 39 protein [Enterococcus sp. JM4C]KAF1297249.1 hypothetical protein BAU15_06790 [Enterococcus sp. JM4C]
MHTEKNQNISKSDNRNIKLLLYRLRKYKFIIFSLLIYSIIHMLLTTKSSPLFWLNDWVDMNSFYTVGKSWLEGLIPYKDLFEQKGPLLYFIYAIAHLLSPNSYLGIFIIETLAFFSSLLLFFSIAQKYLSRNKAFWSTFIFSIFLTLSPFFNRGGGVEEISAPFTMLLLYFIAQLDKDTISVPLRYSIVSGFSIACLFWMKYTMIGGWLAFFLCLSFIFLLKKNWLEIIRLILGYGIGFCIVTLPIILYFTLNNALNDLYYAYFYANLKLYPAVFNSFIEQLLNSINKFSNVFTPYPILYMFLIVGTLLIIIDTKVLKEISSKFMFVSVYLATAISTLFGGYSGPYYYLILLPYIAFTIIIIGRRLFPEEKSSINIFLIKTLFIACFSLIIVLGTNENFKEAKLFTNNPSVSISKDGEKTDRTRPAQLVFADIINKEKKPTLLNYGFLDMGLYRAADITPTSYFFMRQNISHDRMPRLMDEKNEIVNKKKVMFVVTRGEYDLPEEVAVPKNIRDNYTLVAQHSQVFERKFTYRLYKVKQ